MTPRAISPLPVIAPPADLAALVRLVVDRHRRLQQLLDMGAPEIIIGNEKRMLLAALKRMPAVARETDQAPTYEKGRAS